MAIKTKQIILIGSIILSVLLDFTAYATIPLTYQNIGYLATVNISVILFPYSFYIYVKERRIKAMEEHFPSFLKDLSDSLRAGLTMSEAVKTVSSGDYGALTPEINKMANKLSWGVPFKAVMNDFKKKFKKSPFIARGVSILLQAYKSGGDISPIMLSVANSTVQLQNVEKDRQSTMTEQTVVIYMIQLIFVIILIVLFKVLIPITTSGEFGTGILGGDTVTTLDLEYYKLLFFATLIIQSLCNGVVAGVTREGSLAASIKHIAIMFSVSLILYVSFILPKSLTITANKEKFVIYSGEEVNVFGEVKLDNEPISQNEVIVDVNGTIFTGTTDSFGEYQIKVSAPQQTGEYEATVSVNYENKKASETINFPVR